MFDASTMRNYEPVLGGDRRGNCLVELFDSRTFFPWAEVSGLSVSTCTATVCAKGKGHGALTTVSTPITCKVAAAAMITHQQQHLQGPPPPPLETQEFK